MRLVLGFLLVSSLAAVNGFAQEPTPPTTFEPTPIDELTIPPVPESPVPEMSRPEPVPAPIPLDEVLPAPMSTPLEAPALGLPQNSSLLYDTAAELPAIAQALREKRFFSDAGHSMAAAILTGCSPGVEPRKKADNMEAMYRAILDRKFPVIVVSIGALGLPTMEPQISLLAATLVCKQGGRTVVETLDSLDAAFAELQAPPYALKQYFHNLIVAANLMY